jgi:hypothetical protein
LATTPSVMVSDILGMRTISAMLYWELECLEFFDYDKIQSVM